MSNDDNVWTVKPEETTIELQYLGRAFSIRVKKYLTVGEERRIMTAGWRSMSTVKAEAQAPSAGIPAPEASPTSAIQIDWRAQTFARSETYLLGWSMPVPLTREGIESLDPDVYKIVEDAITAHKEAMDSAKKLRTSSSAPAAMSA